MKSFDEFKNMCGVNEKLKRDLYRNLYREFINLMYNLVKHIFNDKNGLSSILSYYKEFKIQLNSGTRDTFFMELDYTPDGTFCLTKLVINDLSHKHRNKTLYLSSMNAIDIEEFFKDYFDEFEKKVIVEPKQLIFDTLEHAINEKIYKKQKLTIDESKSNIKWSYDDFIKSEYSFKINEETRDECQEFIDKYYFNSVEIRKEISKLN